MGASDLIVTKAGPGTIAEATTRGLPVLLSSYMPGQEEGNVSYVLKSRFGTYCDDAEKLGLIVREWLLNPRFEVKLDNMRYRSAKCANPTASIDIARDIGRLIGLREVPSAR
ncbi:monogalactosyldiacylglycerol synthase [Gregarina niphandrodes]|uniref:Monogalactosyldiacylglycerol synthase n=1 Tax=Gregarina niphandrodes TaxID=110365 RepID=A0A023B7G1_GRENI|nr:monogalactosyldiacylglycerol synthase [Gregarina niphandrodes]EZG67295.1 monogalactosyldiacylglycerol synthase [Gregarina niphandrodes]|eukprot:XP_011130274.1 monogalactosyldiacylglycerol synthase [Gregarina niphandrodes]